MSCATHVPDPELRALYAASGLIPAGCWFAAGFAVRSRGRLMIQPCRATVTEDNAVEEGGDAAA